MAQPWLAPDARPDGSGMTAAAVVDPSAVETGLTASVPEPLPLRPMTTADILDGGIEIIKAAPRVIFVVAGALVVPLELVSAWVQRDSLADRGLAGALSAATSTSGSSDVTVDLSAIVLIVASGLVLALVTGAIASLVTSWYAGRAPTAGEVLVASLRRAPALVVAWFFVHVAEAVAAVALVVPVLFVMPLFLVTAPVIVVERLGPWRGCARSWTLTRTRFGSVLGSGLLIAVVSTLLTIALSGLGLAFSFWSFGWVIDVFCRGASTLVTTPFVAAATTLVYLDLRVRTEGLDLELGVAEHFTSAR